MSAGRVAAGRGGALCASNLQRPSGPGGRRGAEGWDGGVGRGTRTHPETRARAPTLLHIHLDCRGAGDGTALPRFHLPFFPPPAAVLPRRLLGAERRGVGGVEVQGRSERRDSRALCAVMSTASAASCPHHLHPGLARAAARGNLGVEKQKACGCPEPLCPPSPFAKVGETGSGPSAVPQLPVRKEGKEENGAVGPGVVGRPRSRGGVCLELVLPGLR